MGYCTVAAVRDQLRGVDLEALGNTAAQDAVMSAVAAWVTRHIDVLCRRTFAPPEQPETRAFDGHGGLVLRVPDMVRLDAVRVGGAAVAPAHAVPVVGPPFGGIYTGQPFPTGHGNVSVTALWGFSAATPDDVALAAACGAAAEVLGRVQAARSSGVRVQVTGLAREEFPPDGAYAERIAALKEAFAHLLLPYRRWVI